MIENIEDSMEVIATPNAKINMLSPTMTPIFSDDSEINSIFQLSNITNITNILDTLTSDTLETDQFATPSSNNKMSCCCNEVLESSNLDEVDLENTIDNTSLCAVCLSPLCKIVVVETKCKHVFHQQCLEEAKARIAKCPLCRTELSPSNIPNSFISRNMRESVVAAAQRGRNAVRLAMLRNNNITNSNTNLSNNISQ